MDSHSPWHEPRGDEDVLSARAEAVYPPPGDVVVLQHQALLRPAVGVGSRGLVPVLRGVEGESALSWTTGLS